MSGYEVPEPILNSPFDEPAKYWKLEEGQAPVQLSGRRPAGYFYRDPRIPVEAGDGEHEARGQWVPLTLVNVIRERVAAWRAQGYPGASRTTLELLTYWQREGRQHRLFFAQREASETIIFLTEARPDFRHGIVIPRDEPSDDRQAEGYRGFTRYACKMATGSGKTTVMGMLAAWSILNKVNDRSDARFSDVVLIFRAKEARRVKLAALPFPEKVQAVVQMQRMAAPLWRARGKHVRVWEFSTVPNQR